MAARKNPAELVIFGNPRRPKGHKAGCACPICSRRAARGRGRRNASRASQMRQARERGVKIRETTRRFKRGNPNDAQQAVRLFQSFHGKNPKEILEAQRSAAMRADYTALGDLIAVGFDTGGLGKKLATRWDSCPHVGFEGDGVKLASAPGGRQLYAIGGNQNLDRCLDMFEGLDREKDLIDLGEAAFVVYDARKSHSHFEPIQYTHEFGEEGGTRPRLLYDRLKKEIAFAGGEYFIDAKHGLSPGIEN